MPESMSSLAKASTTTVADALAADAAARRMSPADHLEKIARPYVEAHATKDEDGAEDEDGDETNDSEAPTA